MYRTAAAILLALAHCSLHAETTLFGGRPQIGIEFEHEKSARGSANENSVTLFPGIVWKEGWINRAELVLMTEHGVESDSGTTVHERGWAYGLRLRKDFSFGDDFGGFVRALVGRAGNSSDSYTYGYFEPALTWEVEPIEMYAGYRMVRALDGSDNHAVNMLRMGPGWDIDDHHGVDLRWARSFAAGSNRRLADSVELEYSYRF